MDDKEIITAFESIAQFADSEAVERKVREKIGKTEYKKVRRPIRLAAAIAAVLILLAVPVAGFGIVYRFATRPVENHFLVFDKDGNVVDHIGGYVVDTNTEFEYVTLPDDKLKELEQYWYPQGSSTPKNIYEYGRIFDNYNELSEWLGLNVLSSDLLGGKPSNLTFGGDIVLYTYGNERTGVHDIAITSSHTINNTKNICNIQIGILLNNVRRNNFGWSSVGADVISTQKYTSKNGIEVEIVESWLNTHSADLSNEEIKNNYKRTNAYFIHEGIKYSLSIHGASDETLALMKQIIDSMK